MEVGLTQQLVGMGDRLPAWLVRSGLDAAALAEAGAAGLLTGDPEDMAAAAPGPPEPLGHRRGRRPG